MNSSGSKWYGRKEGRNTLGRFDKKLKRLVRLNVGTCSFEHNELKWLGL